MHFIDKTREEILKFIIPKIKSTKIEMKLVFCHIAVLIAYTQATKLV